MALKSMLLLLLLLLFREDEFEAELEELDEVGDKEMDFMTCRLFKLFGSIILLPVSIEICSLLMQLYLTNLDCCWLPARPWWFFRLVKRLERPWLPLTRFIRSLLLVRSVWCWYVGCELTDGGFGLLTDKFMEHLSRGFKPLVLPLSKLPGFGLPSN